MHMNRREWLGVAATSLAMAQPRRPPMIIDVHTHFYDPSRPQGVPWPSKNDPTLYRAVLPQHFRDTTKSSGDVRTVVVEASPWLEDNQWILDLAKDDPTIVGFVGNIRPGTPDFRNNLERFAKNRLFRGIRVNPAPLLKEMSMDRLIGELRALEQMNLTLDLLSGPQLYGQAAQIAQALPKLRISLNHLPYVLPEADRQRYDADLEALAKFPRVYAKVSGVLRTVDGKLDTNPSGYQQLFRIFGPKRLLYASNWPLSDRIVDYRTYVDTLVSAYPSQKAEDIDRLLRRNSKDAYGWISR